VFSTPNYFEIRERRSYRTTSDKADEGVRVRIPINQDDVKQPTVRLTY
jgi:hypothetical protein